MKSDELAFAREIQIAMETEDAARVAKKTVFGTKPELLHKVCRSGNCQANLHLKTPRSTRCRSVIDVEKKVTFPRIVGSRTQSAISLSEKVICSRSAERKSSLSQKLNTLPSRAFPTKPQLQFRN